MGEYRTDMADETRPTESQQQRSDEPSEGDPSGVRMDAQEELEQARSAAEQWQDRYLRSAAELANYKKRIEREREQQSLRIRADVLREILPIADDFGLALDNVPAGNRDQPWVQGLLLIAGKVDALLSRSGVESILAVGEPFDPVYHDALMQEYSDDYPEGIVSGEIRRGYTLGDQVLRPTLVRVSSGKSSD